MRRVGFSNIIYNIMSRRKLLENSIKIITWLRIQVKNSLSIIKTVKSPVEKICPWQFFPPLRRVIRYTCLFYLLNVKVVGFDMLCILKSLDHIIHGARSRNQGQLCITCIQFKIWLMCWTQLINSLKIGFNVMKCAGIKT